MAAAVKDRFGKSINPGDTIVFYRFPWLPLSRTTGSVNSVVQHPSTGTEFVIVFVNGYKGIFALAASDVQVV